MYQDYEFDHQKLTIYLGDVGLEQGPFKYVIGSHKFERPEFRLTFFKEFDQEIRCSLTREIYYRPLFSKQKYRSVFAQLPELLQGTSHFGDDILDDTPMSDSLLENELTVTSDKTNFFIFNGSRGIHRGGQVKTGERLVMYIGVSPHVTLFNRLIAKTVRTIQGSMTTRLHGLAPITE